VTTMKTRVDVENRSVAEQAAEWRIILESGDAKDQEAFADWLTRSPLHVGAFLRATAIDELGAQIDMDKSIPIDAGPFEESPDIEPLQETRLSPSTTPSAKRHRKHWGIWLAIAASLGTVAVSVPFALRALAVEDGKHYTAAVGEQRILDLEDGSTLYLSPGSAVDVSIDASARKVVLLQGEAMFRVASDPHRPFAVHSGKTVIQALGTQFSVNRIREDSVVSVVNGVVQISHARNWVERIVPPLQGAPAITPVRLTAGQETRVAEDGSVPKAKAATIDPLKNWQERRLTFVNESLYAIADEFNRYNRSPKIRVDDSRAGEMRFAAAFDADDPESLAVVLQLNPALQVERRPGEIVIFTKR